MSCFIRGFLILEMKDFLGRFVDGLLFLGRGNNTAFFVHAQLYNNQAVVGSMLRRSRLPYGRSIKLTWLSLGGVAQVDYDELWFLKRSTNSPYYTALQTPYSCSNDMLKPVAVPVYKNREL